MVTTHPGEVAYYGSISVIHDWCKAADAAMQYLIRRGEPFSADDLRELLKTAGEPATPNAWGGMFIAYARRGMIHRVGGGPSKRQKRNGGHRHMWVGNHEPENSSH